MDSPERFMKVKGLRRIVSWLMGEKRSTVSTASLLCRRTLWYGSGSRSLFPCISSFLP